MDYPDHLLCSICLELLFKPISLNPCGHVFCEHCLRRLFETSPSKISCPLCRNVIEACLPAEDRAREVLNKYPAQVAERQKSEQNIARSPSLLFQNGSAEQNCHRPTIYIDYSTRWRLALWIFWVGAVGFLMVFSCNSFLNQAIHGGSPHHLPSHPHRSQNNDGPSFIVMLHEGEHERSTPTSVTSMEDHLEYSSELFVSMGSNEIPPVIVDTDTGLDDAGALFMVLEAHRRGLVNVVAITTTHGNTSLDNVNKNVLRLLQTVDMLDIPVYSGSEAPLVHPYPIQGDKPYHGFDGFGNTNLPHPDVSKYIQKKSAVLKILEEVQLNKGRLIVLALGPLTNVALAKKLEPRLLSQLAGLHIMGGNTTGEGNKSPCGEFNFLWDPEAAQIVLSQDPSIATDNNRSPQISAASDQPSTVTIKGNIATAQKDVGGTDIRNCDGAPLLVPCPVYITPWETCIRAVHLPYTFREFLGTKPTPQAILMEKAEAEANAKRKLGDYVTCDQLATAWMLDQLLCDKLLPETDRGSYLPVASKTMECNVTVELQGTHTRGQMVLDRLKTVGYSLPVTLLMGVNLDIYKRYLRMAFGHPF